MEKREFSSDRESKCEQVCLELLLKDGDVMYFLAMYCMINCFVHAEFSE